MSNKPLLYNNGYYDDSEHPDKDEENVSSIPQIPIEEINQIEIVKF